MHVIERVRALINSSSLEDDGSKELALSWEKMLQTEEDLQALLSNKAFLKILQSLRTDFKNRLRIILEGDKELQAIKKMFIRTIGLKETEKQIEKVMDDFLEDKEDS